MSTPLRRSTVEAQPTQLDVSSVRASDARAFADDMKTLNHVLWDTCVDEVGNAQTQRSPRGEILGTVVGTVASHKIGCREPQPIFVNAYFTTISRAGDGTRTHDVQLGKKAEKQEVSGVRANSPMKKRCLVASTPSISRRFRPRMGPGMGPGISTLHARSADVPATRLATSLGPTSQVRGPSVARMTVRRRLTRSSAKSRDCRLALPTDSPPGYA